VQDASSKLRQLGFYDFKPAEAKPAQAKKKAVQDRTASVMVRQVE
jgi:hypothetical protein